jgi:RNA polymerase sigma-70 factor (ECF subfamily)
MSGGCELTDAELMLRFGEGDDDAFRRLVDRHEKPLLGYFWRRCLDRAVAEDCVQEVFLRLVKHRGTWKPDAKFTTYLYRVAENHWIDRYRSKKAAPKTASLEGLTSEDDETSVELPADAPQPGDRAGQLELGRRIRRAVLRLTEEQRAVFALAETRGMRYEEIGRVLGIPVGTVKSRMHAATTRLRELLAEEGRDLLR